MNTITDTLTTQSQRDLEAVTSGLMTREQINNFTATGYKNYPGFTLKDYVANKKDTLSLTYSSGRTKKIIYSKYHTPKDVVESTANDQSSREKMKKFMNNSIIAAVLSGIGSYIFDKKGFNKLSAVFGAVAVLGAIFALEKNVQLSERNKVTHVTPFNRR